MNSLSKLIPTPIRKLFWFVSGSSCGLSFMVLFLLGTGSAFAQPQADLARYEKDVLPLLDKYCMDCHDAETKKGRFDLESLAPDMLSDDDALEQWRLVEEQLHFGEMPRRKEATLRRRACPHVHWVRTELFKTQHPIISVRPNFISPSSATTSTMPPFSENGSASNPGHHAFGVSPCYIPFRHAARGKITGLANGLNVLDGQEIKDYAAPTFSTKPPPLPCSATPRKSPPPSSGQVPETRPSRNWSSGRPAFPSTGRGIHRPGLS